MRATRGFAFLSIAILLAALGACTKKGTPSPSGPTTGGGPSVTVVNVTDGISVTSGGTGTFNWAGQSVTIPAGPGYASLKFNWYTFQGASVAFGTLYLLKQEYLGIPGDLSPSTPGFVAKSDAIVDGQYVFPASAKIDGGTRYWFYTDTQGSFAGSFDTDIYPGGDLYVTGYPSYPFHKAQASGRMVGGTYVPPPPGVFIDANFRLQGAAVQ